MALQEGVLLRNAALNAYNTQLGATATLKIFTGAVPANCAAGDPSGLLATITLPASPFGSASAGVLPLTGSWTVAASGTGVAVSFRVYDSTPTCQMQGSAATDLVLNNTNITAGQTITVTSFSITKGNA